MGLKHKLVNITQYTVDFAGNYHYQALEPCMTQQFKYSTACLYKLICPTMSDYFVNMGIMVIILALILYAIKLYFFYYGYKIFEKWTIIPFFGNIHEIETRVKIDQLITMAILMILLGFIAIVVTYGLGVM